MEAAMKREPAAWAQAVFGGSKLGSARRTRRLVKVAGALAVDPSKSLPRGVGGFQQAKGAYRLLARKEVTVESVSQSHWEQTRQKALGHPVVLLLQDTVVLTLAKTGMREGLGPVGSDGQNEGLHGHSVLAVAPGAEGDATPHALGLAHLKVWARQSAPRGESQWERRQRERESECWKEAMVQVGPCPGGSCRWIHVGDREADQYEVFETAREVGVGFLVRVAGAAAQRGAHLGHADSGAKQGLAELARSLAPRGGLRTLSLRARPGQGAREAVLRVAWSAVTVWAPRIEQRNGWEQAYVVRVWEPDPPPGVKGLEWVLLSSEPVESEQAAWEKVDWYSHRWLIEEYHKCLKTGCAAEKRQLEDGESLKPLVAMLSIMATQLLEIKEHARATPHKAVLETGVAPADHVRMLSLLRKRDASKMTVREFWVEVAKLGGFLGRKSDGDPGWQTTWAGWRELDLMVAGARLFAAPGGSG